MCLIRTNLLQESKLKKKNIFKDKVILVTGGTGSFGNYIVNRLLPLEPKEIRIFSRDEKKQFDMKNHYKNNKILRFFIGDIRDRSRLDSVCRDVDIIYQAAALKHVNACEEALMKLFKLTLQELKISYIVQSIIKYQKLLG